MLLVLMNNYVARCKMLHALSVNPIKKTFWCSLSVSSLSRYLSTSQLHTKSVA